MNNIFKSLIPIIKTVAPTIATALGGPLAGTAVSMLGSALMGDSNATIEQIGEVISAGSPETLLSLKTLEGDFKVRMKELDVDVEQIHSADRASARDREKALKDKAPAAIAAVSFIGFFAVLGILIFGGMPEVGGEPILIMLGVLGTLMTGITQYYFGSSKGSKDKTAQIDRLIK